MPDERQPQQPLVGEHPLDELGVVHPQVGEPAITVGARGVVQQRTRAESLDEAAQLPRGDRALAQVDVARHDAPLAEEPQGGTRRLGVVGAEDLDVGHPVRR